MTITLGTPVTVTKLNITFKDVQEQTLPVTMYFQNAPAESDAGFLTNLAIFLADMDAISNATIYGKLEKTTITPFTSDTLPLGLINFATVDQVLDLMFSAPNPLKPGLKLNAGVPVPAYIVGTASLDYPNAGVPKTADTQVARIISFVEDHLITRYEGNGQYYGGYTYNAAKSGGVSLPDSVDNQ